MLYDKNWDVRTDVDEVEQLLLRAADSLEKVGGDRENFSYKMGLVVP